VHKEKLLGSDREGLGLGIIDHRSEPDRQSEPINFDLRPEPNTMLNAFVS